MLKKPMLKQNKQAGSEAKITGHWPVIFIVVNQFLFKQTFYACPDQME